MNFFWQEWDWYEIWYWMMLQCNTSEKLSTKKRNTSINITNWLSSAHDNGLCCFAEPSSAVAWVRWRWWWHEAHRAETMARYQLLCYQLLSACLWQLRLQSCRCQYRSWGHNEHRTRPLNSDICSDPAVTHILNGAVVVVGAVGGRSASVLISRNPNFRNAHYFSRPV